MIELFEVSMNFETLWKFGLPATTFFIMVIIFGIIFYYSTKELK